MTTLGRKVYVAMRSDSAAGVRGGFITLHRQIEEWDLWRSLSGEQRHVVTTLLLMANWKDDAFWFGTEKIAVRRGQLAHSLASIADRAAVSVKVVRTVLAKLLADGFISAETGTQDGRRPRVITIRNYDRFQRLVVGEGTQEGTQRARKGHAAGTQGALREPEEPREPVKSSAVAPAPAVPSEADVVRAWGVQELKFPEEPPKGDPRHAPMVKSVCDAFAEVRGAKYPFTGRDAKVVTTLLGYGTDADILGAWRAALSSDGFPTVRTLAELVTHWTHFVGKQASAKRPVIEAPATFTQRRSGGFE